jgi:putative glutathione S-transferase
MNMTPEPATQAGRYHLIVSLACPFSQRALIARSLKGLQDAVSVDVVHPHLDRSHGWEFRETFRNTVSDAKTLKQFYQQCQPDFRGKASVPVLYDKQLRRIVSTDSDEIVEFLNGSLQSVAKQRDFDLLPKDIASKVEQQCTWLHENINMAVYRAGYAKSQKEFDEAVGGLFYALDELNQRLESQRYVIAGNRMTAADVFLFPTLFRFDAIYFVLFRCCRKRLVDYPLLWDYAREMYANPAVRETCDLQQCMMHYYTSNADIHPTRIVPPVPEVEWEAKSMRRWVLGIPNDRSFY